MNKLLCVGFFGLGVGVGVLSTRLYFKNKCDKRIKEALEELNAELHKVIDEATQEIEAKKEEAKNVYPFPDPVIVRKNSPLTEEKPDIMDFYKEKVEKEGYTDYSTQVEGDSVEKKFNEEPYVISPEAIGEMDGYSVISLTLFSDGVLADDDFEPMEQDEIADCIGEDYQDHFGDFEDDAVHIRNDIHRTDYEILKDLRSYDEVAKLKPRKVRLNE